MLIELISANFGWMIVLELGEDEGGAGDVADFAGAGGDAPAAFEPHGPGGRRRRIREIPDLATN
ncbi:hypothetical protein ABT352_30985 [Streptosporangium sp. NPDC000563]|uniref:hypothetical protein n=1 Tax=unclassified Streptosporangium TaxID=2632669 RepID=UPI003326886F